MLDPATSSGAFETSIDAASGGLPCDSDDQISHSDDLVLKTTQKYITVKGKYESALSDL